MINPLQASISIVDYSLDPTKQKRSSAGPNCLVCMILGGSVQYTSEACTELVFLNPYGDQESMPTHQFRQPM
jgi:hypothetical protein